MEKLTTLPNIGKELEKQLNEVGIFSVEDLENIGSFEAWKLLRKNNLSVCINKLYALEGALQRVRWRDLPSDTKIKIQDYYKNKHTL